MLYWKNGSARAVRTHASFSWPKAEDSRSEWKTVKTNATMTTTSTRLNRSEAVVGGIQRRNDRMKPQNGNPTSNDEPCEMGRCPQRIHRNICQAASTISGTRKAQMG